MEEKNNENEMDQKERKHENDAQGNSNDESVSDSDDEIKEKTDDCLKNIAPLTSLLFKYSQEKIHGKLSTYLSNYGIAAREVKYRNLPFYLMLWYFERIGLMEDKAHIYQNIKDNAAKHIGFMDRKLVCNQQCITAISYIIDQLAKTNLIFSFSEKEEMSLIAMIQVYLISIFNGENKSITEQLKLLAGILGIKIKLLSNDTADYEVINSKAPLICNIQKITEEDYWVLYQKYQITHSLWYDSVEYKLHKKKKLIEKTYTERVMIYNRKINILKNYLEKYYKLAYNIQKIYDNTNSDEIKDAIKNIENTEINCVQYICKEDQTKFDIVYTISLALSAPCNIQPINDQEYDAFIADYEQAISKVRDALMPYKKKEIAASIIIEEYSQSVANYLKDDSIKLDKVLSDIAKQIAIRSNKGCFKYIISFSNRLLINYEIFKILTSDRERNPNSISKVITLLEGIGNIQIKNEDIFQTKIRTATLLSNIIIECYETIKELPKFIYADIELITIWYNASLCDEEKCHLLRYYIEYTQILVECIKANHYINEAYIESAKQIDKLTKDKNIQILNSLKEDCKIATEFMEHHNIKYLLQKAIKLNSNFYRDILKVDAYKGAVACLQLEKFANEPVLDNKLIQMAVLDDIIKQEYPDNHEARQNFIIQFLLDPNYDTKKLKDNINRLKQGTKLALLSLRNIC